MRDSVEIAVKKIILENFAVYKNPIGESELFGLVAQAVGRSVEECEFQSILKKLKEGLSILENPVKSYSPLYEAVEDENE